MPAKLLDMLRGSLPCLKTSSGCLCADKEHEWLRSFSSLQQFARQTAYRPLSFRDNHRSWHCMQIGWAERDEKKDKGTNQILAAPLERSETSSTARLLPLPPPHLSISLTTAVSATSQSPIANSSSAFRLQSAALVSSLSPPQRPRCSHLKSPRSRWVVPLC
jgi:hypothetical protein